MTSAVESDQLFGDLDLVIPCLNEAPALRDLLPRIPSQITVIVVDNGSSDDTVAVAIAGGARVVHAAARGYGSAVHAGIEAATSELVAVMDGDGSLDPADLAGLAAEVRSGRADLAMGRRVPVRRGVWPWHARLGNRLVLSLIKQRTGLSVRDIGPLRVVRRRGLLELGIEDRGMGYPLELLDRAGRAGWRVIERDVAYYPRAAGTTSKVSGSVRGTLRTVRDFGKVLTS